MNFYQSNILAALEAAIKAQEVREKELGYTGDSGMLTGWRKLKKWIEEGKQICIRYE